MSQNFKLTNKFKVSFNCDLNDLFCLFVTSILKNLVLRISNGLSINAQMVDTTTVIDANDIAIPKHLEPDSNVLMYS
jgi:hypothetical protein